MNLLISNRHSIPIFQLSISVSNCDLFWARLNIYKSMIFDALHWVFKICFIEWTHGIQYLPSCSSHEFMNISSFKCHISSLRWDIFLFMHTIPQYLPCVFLLWVLNMLVSQYSWILRCLHMTCEYEIYIILLQQRECIFLQTRLNWEGMMSWYC